jgi:hypothetical protein
LAKRNFLSYDFVKGIDYEVFHVSPQTTNGGRPTEQIKLTVDCFKRWALKLNTEFTAKLIEYFFTCEEIAKQSIDLGEIGKNISKKEICRAGFVYLIQADETRFYKIGKSKDIYKRLETLQVSSYSKLIVIHRIFSTNYTNLEKKLHIFYQDFWARGEWFEFSDDIVNGFLSVANAIECEEEIKTLDSATVNGDSDLSYPEDAIAQFVN